MGLSRQRGRVFPGPPPDVSSVLKLLPPLAQSLAADLPPEDREVLAHLVARNCSSSPSLDLAKNSSSKKKQPLPLPPLVGPVRRVNRSSANDRVGVAVCSSSFGAAGNLAGAHRNLDVDHHHSGADRHSGVHQSPVVDQHLGGPRGSSGVDGSSSSAAAAQHRPSLFCACFHCYSVFWRRWNSSPHHCLINDILDLLDDHLMASSGPPYASLRSTSVDDSVAAKKKRRKKKKKKTSSKKEEEEEEQEEKEDGQEIREAEENKEEEAESDRLDALSWQKGGVGSSSIITCSGDNHSRGYGQTDAPLVLEEQEERRSYAVCPVYESSEGAIDLLEEEEEEEEEDNPNSDRSSLKDPKSSFLTRVFFLTTTSPTTTTTASTSTSLESLGLTQRIWEMFSFRGGKKAERA